MSVSLSRAVPAGCGPQLNTWMIYLVLNIFLAIVYCTLALLPATPQSSVIALLHVSATHCSQRPGAMMLERHKQRIICQEMVNTCA